MRWKVEGGSKGERGGKSGHGTSTHHQFIIAVYMSSPIPSSQTASPSPSRP